MTLYSTKKLQIKKKGIKENSHNNKIITDTANCKLKKYYSRSEFLKLFFHGRLRQKKLPILYSLKI